MISQYTILFVDRKFLILCHAFVFNDYISIYTYAITQKKQGLQDLKNKSLKNCMINLGIWLW